MVEATVNSVATTFAYRGDGLRDSRAVGMTTTTFTWDINAGLPLVLDDGNQYLYGAGLSAVKQSGNWFYYLADGLGSTMAIVDADGDVQNGYTYDINGEPTVTGNLANEFDFAGQQTDPTGLQYLRARYYDPETGVFLSREPLAIFPVWLGNTTSYAAANPASATDPSGLKPVDSDGTPTQVTPNPPVPYGGEGGPIAVCPGYCWEIADPSSIGLSLPNGSWLTQRAYNGVREDFYRICYLVSEYGYECSLGADASFWRSIARENTQRFHKAEEIFKLASTIYGTNKAAREAAKAMGWKKVKVDWQAKAKNQDVFTDGKNYYSRDIDSHSGGAWKVFDSKGHRIGTIDRNGNWIGD